MLYPREYNQVNVGGTVTLMEAMRDVGVRRVVFISSGAIYGDQPVQPLKETSITNPRSPYAVSKLAAEYYVRTIGSLWGIETVCLRVFNAYGPGQHIPPVHAPVIPNLLRQASLNGTIVVHGDGMQTRDYVYVEDVVNAMVTASSAPDVNQLIINIGSGRDTSVRELVRLVLEITGGHPEVVFNPRTERGPIRMCADLGLAREKLGYQISIPLEIGLKMTLERDLRLR
jgi:UDP-glucose 4-epimerase